MMLAFDRPLVCPVLVGREACVEAIDRAVEEVRGGRGQALLISGDMSARQPLLVVFEDLRWSDATSLGVRRPRPAAAR